MNNGGIFEALDQFKGDNNSIDVTKQFNDIIYYNLYIFLLFDVYIIILLMRIFTEKVEKPFTTKS